MKSKSPRSAARRTVVVAAASASAVVVLGVLVVAPLVLRSSSRIDQEAAPAGPDVVSEPGTPGSSDPPTVVVQAPLNGGGAGGAFDASSATLPDGSSALPTSTVPGAYVDGVPEEFYDENFGPPGAVDPRIPPALDVSFPGGEPTGVIEDPNRDGRARRWTFRLGSAGTCAGLQSGVEAMGALVSNVSCLSDMAYLDGLYQGLFLRATLSNSNQVSIELWI